MIDNLLKKKFADYKSGLECKVCNKKTDLTFHHLIPAEKTAGVCDLFVNDSAEKINKEIAKCLVLCKKCHQDYHWEENTRNDYKRKFRQCKTSKNLYNNNLKEYKDILKDFKLIENLYKNANKEKREKANRLYQAGKKILISTKKYHIKTKEKYLADKKKYEYLHKKRLAIDPKLTPKINGFRDEYKKNPPKNKIYVALQ